MSVFIVAEAGVNHLGDRAKMLALCDAAKAAGADAVKFQAYDVDKLAERRGYYDWSRDWGEVGDGTPQPKPEHAETVALLEEAQLSDADLDAIAAHCKAIGLKWFASVFDPSQIERVLSRGACALKIGHAESDWIELHRAVASAADERGLPWWRSVRSDDPREQSPIWEQSVYCVAEYPATTLPQFRKFGWQVEEYEHWDGFRGFSSHYTDYRIPAAAALRGAEYIEAHLRLRSSDPEAAWSLDQFDFAAMVKLIREYEEWL